MPGTGLCASLALTRGFAVRATQSPLLSLLIFTEMHQRIDRCEKFGWGWFSHISSQYLLLTHPAGGI